MDHLIQNGVLYQYHGEYVDGKPIIPDGVEDIYPSALGYGNDNACTIYKEGKYLGTSDKRNVCILEKYTGNNNKIQVPASILGYPVAEIGKFCFSTGIHAHSGGRHGSGPQQKHNKKIVEVLIPNSVKYIADYAFSGCKKLETVKVPYNCRVDDTAFYGCD